ncbi:Os1348 family NHLP clan protein [Streptomyces longwoodensis]|uniref:Os1348 family NHLP clan protein n=1 Tax=Streptomyces longwoodensis TaxID=68231 RepID=UPI0022535DDF|nr:Os1348 family NHLP clan protein [Streptomyces longwoodensis]MCX5000787.1 Os1348 family NHLP clan protein [Streptomyces longwoodensis]
MSQQVAEYSAEQIADANKAALAMEALIGRLSHDEDFAVHLANNPRETLEASGLRMEKEAVQSLMAIDPERFDKLCESLFDLVDSDFLHAMTAPSCA